MQWKRKNLIGNIYGELKVIEMLYNYQNKKRTYCKCIGINDTEYKEYIVRQDALQSGATISTKGVCTGGKPHDLTGQRFGMLTALYPTEKRASNGGVRWHCICACGKETNPDPTMNNLTRYHTLSCGCRKNSKWEIFIQKYLAHSQSNLPPDILHPYFLFHNCHLKFVQQVYWNNKYQMPSANQSLLFRKLH